MFQVFAYELAIAAERSGTQVHAVCVMGNHYHAVVTDPSGQISEFYQYLHEFTAKCLNASRGRAENLWSCTETSRVRLEDLDAIVNKIEYTLNNPVSSWIVSKATKWTGLRRWWVDPSVTVERPAYFRENGPMPASATLELTPPPGLDELADKGVALIEETLARGERQLQAKARAEGIRFVGARNVAKQRWHECPASFSKRRGIRPQVATRNKWRRIEAVVRNRQFELDHAEALKEWRAGNREVVFPYGTYLMRVLHHVRCAPPPT